MALPVVVTLIVGACSADPTPTSAPAGTPTATSAPSPTATPTRAPTPTPTPLAPLLAVAEACEPSESGTVFEVAEFVVGDGQFELVIGSEGFWRYDAAERVSSRARSGILMTVESGDTIRIGKLSSSSTDPHGLTVAGLGIDIELAPGGSQDNVDIVACDPGRYVIDDYRDAGTHGLAEIIVEKPVPLARPPIVFEIDEIVMEDGKIELRIGDEPYWGYAAKDRLSSAEGDGLLITVRVGDTLAIGAVRMSEDRSTVDHNMTIEGLGIDIPTAGVLSLREAPEADRILIVFDKEGTFAIDDSVDPGTHGTFNIVVEPGGIPAPKVYEIDEIVMEDGKIELRIGDEPYWGYAAKDRLSSAEGDGLFIEVNVGDTLSIGAVRMSEDRSTIDHNMTIEGLGVDIPTAGVLSLREAPDADRILIVFDKAGTFFVDDSVDPGTHGKFTITVKAVGPAPTTYEIDEIVMEDGKIELRIGTEPYWGYAAKDRLSSTEGDGLFIELNVGDSLSIGAVRMSEDRSTIGHHMTIEGMGIDIPTEGVLSLREAPDADRIVIVFDKAGTFFVDDSVDPGTHGKFEITVK